MEEGRKNTGETLSPSSKKRADNRTLAVELYFQGFGIADIARKIRETNGRTVIMNVIQSWIRETLKALEVARPDVVQNFKHIELEKVNRLEVAYWKAWAKSSAEQVTTKEIFEPFAAGKRLRGKKKEDPGELKSVIRETKTLTGEARFLQGVQWCIEQRIKLLGTEGAVKNEFGEGEVKDPTAEAVKTGAEELTQPRRIVFRVGGAEAGTNAG